MINKDPTYVIKVPKTQIYIYIIVTKKDKDKLQRRGDVIGSKDPNRVKLKYVECKGGCGEGKNCCMDSYPHDRNSGKREASIVTFVWHD